ncbi:MAG: DUF1987 domain-containing protein [Bacteroidia bacterium]|nr:DUF1987 domain-containing protein [Bacteroidia bacterium]
MEYVYEIKATEDTPAVTLHKTNGLLSISGKSLPEDSATFYQPVIEWLSVYLNNAPSSTTAEFKLEYFNTSSSKQIFKIISLLKELSKTKSVAIKWYFDKGDKDMQLSGERFSKLCQMPIETIQN